MAGYLETKRPSQTEYGEQRRKAPKVMKVIRANLDDFEFFDSCGVPRDRGDVAGFLETKTPSQTDYGEKPTKFPIMKVIQPQKLYRMRLVCGQFGRF